MKDLEYDIAKAQTAIEQELARAREDTRRHISLFEEIAELNSCEHPPDDGSDDLCDYEECLHCACQREVDAMREGESS